MFESCSNLRSITCLATTTATSATMDWVKNVSASGTFKKASGATWPTGNTGIPYGWNVEDFVPGI